MKRPVSILALLIAASALPATAHAAGTINIPASGGSIGSWGPPSASTSGNTYGQVFTALDALITDYSFQIGSSNSFSYVSQVFAWTGTGVSGAALYTSDVRQTPTATSTVSFLPNVVLTTGASYIALVTNRPGGTSLGGSGRGTMPFGTAPSGFTFTSGSPAAGSTWFDTGYYSAAFHADFAGVSAGAVPEPATWASMVLGLSAVGFSLRRRKTVTQLGAA